MIYVVQCSGSGFCKVGFTANKTTLNSRISSLQTGNPNRIVLIGTTDGGMAKEGNIHTQLQRKHKHVRGEWFSLDANDVQKILGHANGFKDGAKIQSDLLFNGGRVEAIEKKCRGLEKTLAGAMRWNEHSREHIENLLAVIRRQKKPQAELPGATSSEFAGSDATNTKQARCPALI